MTNNNSVTTRAFSPLADIGLDNDPMTHLTRVFVYFLQNLFRDFPEGCGMRWRPNEESTEIMITAEKPRLDSIEKMPHITCVLGSAAWANTSLDQMLSTRISDGQRKHTDLIPMTVAFHCQAKEGLVARRIAWYASKYVNVFRRVIMRGGGLHHVSPAHQISAETGPTAYTGPVVEDEIVAVVVTVPFYWQDGWTITKPAQLWRRLRIELTVNKTQSLYSAGRTNLIRVPRVNGTPVTSVPLDPTPAIVQVSLDENFVVEED